MNKIQNLINKRNTAFGNTTKQIFEKLEPLVLNTILEFLEIDQSVETIYWSDVDIIEGKTEPAVLILGSVSYSLGATVLLSTGETIEVTEDLVSNFKRWICIAIPISLVESSKEQIWQFLEKQQAQYMNKKQSTQIMDNDTEFDLSVLTEEQRTALQMFNKRGMN